MGPEMMNEFRAQAERFGTRFITDDATELELTDGGVQRSTSARTTYRAKAVILSMGAEPKRLGIPGEMELGAAASPPAASATAPSSRARTSP